MTMTETETRTRGNIYYAITQVMAEVGQVAKTGRGPAAQSSYPFMPIDAIVGQLQPLMAEHGIVCVPKVLKEKVEIDLAKRFNADGTEARDGRQENIRTRVRMQIRYRFAAHDGSHVDAVVSGEAHDTADKALNKAETAAYKKALVRVFSIAPGDTDPDSQDGANTEAPEAAPAPGARRTRRQQGMDRTRGVGDVTKAAVDVPSVPADVPPAPASVPARQGPAEPIEQHDALEPFDPTTLDGKPAQPQTITEAKAEQQEAAWKPDPADIAHAEQNAPAAPAPTQVEQRAEDIAAIKSELRRAWSARGLTREQANAIGDRVTGKPRTEWMLRKDSLTQVLKAIQDGAEA